MSEFLWSHHHFPLRSSIWVMFVHPAAPVALADQPAEQKSWAPAGWSLWPHIHSEIPGKPWAFCVSPVHEPGPSLAPRLCWTSPLQRNSRAHQLGIWCELLYIHAGLSTCFSSGSIRPTDPKGSMNPSKYGLRIVWAPQGTPRHMSLLTGPDVYKLGELGG